MTGVESHLRKDIKALLNNLEGDELELVTSIHCVADPNSLQYGMTLEGEEVETLSKLLKKLGC